MSIVQKTMVNIKKFHANSINPGMRSLEYAFLIYCSRTAIDDAVEEKLRQLTISGLDWHCIVDKAERQGVAQFLYYHLSGLEEIWNVIPEKCKVRLKQFYYTVLSQNAVTQIELQKVISLLNNAQIPAIVLKGASLLETVYKNIGLRPMVDVDLLVKKEDLSQIKSVLHYAGYIKPDNLDQENLEKFGAEVRLYKNGGLFLDIHANLSQYERFQNVFQIDADEEVWSISRIIQSREGNLRILSTEHQILHLCLHQAMSHAFCGLFRFIDLRETILAYSQEINWQNLIAQAEKYKIKKIVYYCLFFTKELFGDTIPEDILMALKPPNSHKFITDFILSLNKIKSLPDLEPPKKSLIQLFLMDNFSVMPKVIWRGLFPSDEWLIYKYRINSRVKLIYFRLFHPLLTILNMI